LEISQAPVVEQELKDNRWFSGPVIQINGMLINIVSMGAWKMKRHICAGRMNSVTSD
jgi:hypothetical protein